MCAKELDKEEGLAQHAQDLLAQGKGGIMR